MEINKKSVKIKSEELNIPFANLLAGAVGELIIEILAEGQYQKELYLNNAKEYAVENYKKTAPRHIYYEFIRQLDDKMAYLYLRDINKEIISKLGQSGFEAKSTVEEKLIKLQITCDGMYIPYEIHFEKKKQTAETAEVEKIKLTMFNEKSVMYYTSPKEDILIKHLVEIFTKLELINEMDHYYDTYEILNQYPINGRKVKDVLLEELKSKKVIISEKPMKTISGYRDYTYMKKKWKVQLRQKKTSSPSWEDVIICLSKFMEPIWDAMVNDYVFLGDWMPQIKRFLD